MNSSKSGKFIVFEGADGAGTTTQSELLEKDLVSVLGPKKVLRTCEPSNSIIGITTRKILSGSEGPLGSVWGWRELSYLFMADRAHHVSTVIRPALKAGITVICDRYYASTLVYQSIDAGNDSECLRRMMGLYNEILRDEYLLQPDIWIYLSVPDVKVLSERLISRKSKELYEVEETQRRVIDGYESWYGLTATTKPRTPILRVDGTRSIEDINAQCFNGVRAKLFP